MLNPNLQHCLYRMYDNAGQLLYIGITGSLSQRFTSHHEKPWWPSVADVTVEMHPNRAAVLDAEKAAIRDEKPLHNVVHNGTPPPTTRPAGGTQLRCGDVVALGLDDYTCPVGVITELTETYLILDLYSWFTGDFGYDEALVDLDRIVGIRKARPMGAEAARELGYRRGQTVYDTDPLGRFQTMWKREKPVTAAEGSAT